MPAPEHPPRPLTARQRQALDFITGYTARHGYAPTYREIGDHMGLVSTNAVDAHVQALRRKGYLKTSKGKARALQVTHRPRGAVARLVAGIREVGEAFGVELGPHGAPLPSDWIHRFTTKSQPTKAAESMRAAGLGTEPGPGGAAEQTTG